LSGALSGEIGALIDHLVGLGPRVFQHLALADEECSRLASTENGASPRLSLAIGIWCFSANSSSLVREVSSHSRHGAITLMSGFSA
jgi:hypothetical protein